MRTRTGITLTLTARLALFEWISTKSKPSEAHSRACNSIRFKALPFFHLWHFQSFGRLLNPCFRSILLRRIIVRRSRINYMLAGI